MQTCVVRRWMVMMAAMAAVAVSAAGTNPVVEAPLPLDLTKLYHTNFFSPKYKGGATNMPQGAKTLDGIPFQIIGQLGLWGRTLNTRGTKHPEEVTGIVVGRKFEELHLVHHAFWNVEDGTPVALVRAWYADGTSNDFPIVYGKHVRDWYRLKYEEKESITDPATKIWWRGNSASAARLTGSMRMFKTTFTNPQPDQVVKSLDLISTKSPVSYSLIAATVSARDPKRKLDPALKPGEPDRKFAEELRIEVRDAATDNVLPDVMLDASVSDDTGGYPLSVYFTGEHGEKVIRYPTGKLKTISMSVSREGYGSTYVNLSVPFPKERVIKLKPAMSIGGVVKDEDGQPVKGARLNTYSMGSFNLEEAERNSVSGNATTDASGAWTMNSIPRGATNFGFSLSHPNFPSTSVYLETDKRRFVGPVQRTSLKELMEKTAVFVMKKGIVMKGVVNSPEGTPVKGAKVLFAQSPYSSGEKGVTTDDEGKFTAKNLSERHEYLTVDAEDYAPYQKKVTPARDAEPMVITLEKGLTIKGRVVDKEKKPVENANVAIGREYSSSSGGKNWKGVTDAEGKFSWTGAGSNGIDLTITKKGYVKLNTRAQPSEEEREYKLKTAGTVKGTVTDAETRAPIAGAKITSGTAYSDDRYNWHQSTVSTDTNGVYKITLDEGDFGEQLIKVEAEGYDPGLSQPFPNSEGEQTADFQLSKGGTIKGTVVYSTGGPVVGAQVASARSGGYLSVSASGFQSYDGETKVARTDAEGKFELKIAADILSVAVSHKDGTAQATLAALGANPVIVLQSFGRIEGTMLADGKPRTNVDIMLSAPPNSPGMNYQFDGFRVSTDAEGKFVMDKVPAGEHRLVRLKQMTPNSWRHVNSTPVFVKPGETTQVIMGGEAAHTVVGRAVFNQPGKEIDWTNADVSLSTQSPSPPSGITSTEAMRAWNRSPEYKESMKNYRNYGGDMSADGTFRVDDVEPGTYNLRVSIYSKTTDSEFGFGPSRRSIASFSKTVTVSDEGARRVDVGAVELKAYESRTPTKKPPP